MAKTAEELFREYEGEIVPRTIHGGFVVLSYFISWLGALSTLELINRRTSHRGLFNYVLLIAASVTMGGVAIWCMHFIGNRAIILAHGEPSLQISYSAGFTVLSFFVPIIVLLLAFTAIGTDHPTTATRISASVRVVGSGSLAGSAICGMHYLGDASISNYSSEYSAGYVVGAAFIAIAASIVALAVFFVFRHAWANSWWKTLGSAVVLAGAVSGMHWCASMGTRYRLREGLSPGNAASINKSVIAVIVLSVATCLGMAGAAIYRTKAKLNSAKKAQQVVLGAAVFDRHGRILIDRNGFLPNESVTDTFLDRSSKEQFDTNHPLFHWMFRASRNWSGIQPLLDGMANHLAQLPRYGRDRDARATVNLVTEHGDVMEGYDILFRELFCVAANTLATKMKESISDAGVLWEEILATGTGVLPDEGRSSGESDGDLKKEPRVNVRDLEKGRPRKGSNGSLMLLVKRVDREDDIARLGAAGYRFVDVHQAAGHIAATMQIKDPDFDSKFRDIARYLEPKQRLVPGVHIGFFGLRPRGNGSTYDVLVRKQNKSLLPSVRLPFDKLSTWQADFLFRLEGMTVAEMEKKQMAWRNLSQKETNFVSRLLDAMQDLRTWVGDKVVESAILTPQVTQVSCGGGPKSATATLIALRIVMPPKTKVISANCTFIPLSLFKVHQLTAPSSPHHLAFSHAVHRELAPIINGSPSGMRRSPSRKPGARPFPSKLKKFGRPGRTTHHVDGDRNPVPVVLGQGSRSRSMTNGSSSTLKLWDRSSVENGGGSGGGEMPYETVTPPMNLSMLGGIMISEEVTVNVQELSGGSARTSGSLTDRDETTRAPAPPGEEGGIEMDRLHGTATMRFANVEVENRAELVTFVDELYALCMDDRER